MAQAASAERLVDRSARPPRSRDAVEASSSRAVAAPPHSMQHALLRMQREHGNQFVGAMLTRLDRSGGSPLRSPVPIAPAPAKPRIVATAPAVDASHRPLQRDLVDDFEGKVSDLGAAAVSGVRDAGAAVASGAGAVADRVGATIDDAGHAIASGAHAVGQGLNDAADAAGAAIKGGAATVSNAIGSGVKAIGTGVQNAGQAVANAAAGPIDWLLTEAGKLALQAANAIASKFGGKVVVSPEGGIDIIFSDVKIAEVDSETIVLPLGIPYEPVVIGGLEVGTFVIVGSLGSVIGDPAVTVAAGPVRLQHMRLHLDPLGGTYAGTGQLFIGSEVVGTGEKATEGRVQAAGVLPFEVPIPIEASAVAGARDILRIAGRESLQETVAVTYKDGRFEVDANVQMKLGALAQIDREKFVRIEIEGLEVCSVIWPKSSRRLAADAVQITVPVSLTGGDDGAKVGKPDAKRIPVDAIETSLDHSRPPNHCLKLSELAPFLCKIGKLPPDVCAIVDPKGNGGGTVTPTGPVPLGPGPVGPGGGGGGGGGGKGRGDEPVGPLADDPGCAPKQGFLFRGMKRDGGSPVVGDNSGSELGVRNGEVQIGKDGNVVLNGAGMSTTPDNVKDGPKRLIPPKCGGDPKNKDTLFAVAEAAVKSTDGLGVNRDKPGHANVIPTKPMTLETFRDKVHGTAPSWQLLVEGER